jgi:MSHA biogenesis protein MshE
MEALGISLGTLRRGAVHAPWIVCAAGSDDPSARVQEPHCAADIAVVLELPKPAWLPLGSLLVREGLLTHEQLEEALLMQQGTGRRLGELLVEWGWVNSRGICEALAEQYEMEFVDLATVDLDPAAVNRLDEADARSFRAIPIRFLSDRRLLVGVADPTDVGAAEELRAVLGAAIRLAVVDQRELEDALFRAYTD